MRPRSGTSAMQSTITKELQKLSVAKFSADISDEEWQRKMEDIMLSQKSPSEKIADLMPFFKEYRAYNLQKLQNAFAKKKADFSLSDYESAQDAIEKLENVPENILIEEQIAKLQKFIEEGKKLEDGPQKKIADVLSGLIQKSIEQKIAEINAAIKGEKSPSKAEIDFEPAKLVLETNAEMAKKDRDNAQKERSLIEASFNQEISQKNQEIAEKQNQINATKKKDNAPFRRFFRTFTFGRAFKKTDISASEKDVAKLKNEVVAKEKEQNGKISEQDEIIKKNSKILENRQAMEQLVAILEKDFALKTASKEKTDPRARDAEVFLAGILQKNPEIQQRLEKERGKRKQEGDKKGVVEESVAKSIKQRIENAMAIGRNEVVQAPTKASKALAAVGTVVENIPVPVVSQVLNALVFVASRAYEKKRESQYERVGKFFAVDQDKATEIFDKITIRISQDYAGKVTKDSAENFAKIAAQKIINTIKSGAVKMEEGMKVDDLVEKIYDNIRGKKSSTIDKTRIELENERQNASAQSLISNQAIRVKDKDGKEITLVRDSRQKGDELLGEHKYGVRQASESEQKSYLDGGIKGYSVFITKEKRLEGELRGILGRNRNNGIKDGQGSVIPLQNNLEEIFGKIKAIADNVFADDNLDLKTQLAQEINVGKRGALNIADDDRKIFNEIKNVVEEMIEFKKAIAKNKEIAGKYPSKSPQPTSSVLVAQGDKSHAKL